MAEIPTIVASTWRDGLFVLDESGLSHERPGRSVRGLASDLRGGVLAVVDGRSLFQRTSTGEWCLLATSETDL